MERQKKIINIENGHPSVRMPFDLIDRLQAEGVKNMSLNIDDVTETITIRPIFPEVAK